MQTSVMDIVNRRIDSITSAHVKSKTAQVMNEIEDVFNRHGLYWETSYVTQYLQENIEDYLYRKISTNIAYDIANRITGNLESNK